jgi:hypothetical protein
MASNTVNMNIETSQQLLDKLGEVRMVESEPNQSEPKPHLTPYIFFCRNMRQHIKDLHPSWNSKEIIKEFGRLWREEMTVEMKEPYVTRAMIDKDRYIEEMNEYTIKRTRIYQDECKDNT